MSGFSNDREKASEIGMQVLKLRYWAVLFRLGVSVVLYLPEHFHDCGAGDGFERSMSMPRGHVLGPIAGPMQDVS